MTRVDMESAALVGPARELTDHSASEDAATRLMRELPKIPGLDISSFRNLLARALSGDPDVPPAFKALFTSSGQAKGKEQQDKESEDFFSRFIRLQAIFQEKLSRINDRLDDLARIRDILEARVIANEARIEENSRWIDDTRRRHGSASGAMNHFVRHGYLEHDEDGSLKNKAVQRLLEDYAHRTGKKLNSDIAIAFAIQEQIRFEEAEILRRRAENDGLGQDIKKDKIFIEQIDKEAQELLSRRNEILKKYENDPEGAAREIEALFKSVKSESVLQKIKELEGKDSALSHQINKAISATEEENDLKVAMSSVPDDAMFKKISGNFNANADGAPAPNMEPDAQQLNNAGIGKPKML